MSLSSLLASLGGHGGAGAAALYVARHTPLGSLVESVVDNLGREGATPPPGAIVHCSLWGAEHSGVHVGGGHIVNLEGTGLVRRVDRAKFVRHTNALTVYVACAGGSPLGSEAIAARARAVLGQRRAYDILRENCHCFTAACITGQPTSDARFFHLLEAVIGAHMNGGAPITWRAWPPSRPSRPGGSPTIAASGNRGVRAGRPPWPRWVAWA